MIDPDDDAKSEDGKETKQKAFVVDNGSELGKKLLGFHLDDKSADFKFLVGPGSVEIPVHKLVIGAWSDPLRAMLFGPMAEAQEGKAVITHKEPEIFKVFLRYLYSGQAELTKDNLGPLLEIANEYDVTSLVDACLKYMDQELSHDNVCHLLNVAYKYQHTELFEKYLKYIYMHAPFVLESEGVADLDEEVLRHLLASDNLAAREVDIFSALLRWVGADETRKAKLEGLLRNIRWAQMSLRDLMKVVRPSGLLDEEQLLAALDFAADPKDAPENKFYEGWNIKPREPPSVHCKSTNAFSDNTGIFYYLGTDEGKGPFRNPYPDIVGVTMSSTAGAAIHNVTDRNIASGAVENRYGGEPNPWIMVEFKKHRVKLEHYFIAQEQDHYLRNWRLEASNDGVTWVTVRTHTADNSITSAQRTAFFEAATETFFQRFRIYVTGPSHNGAPNFDITELEFFGHVAPLSLADISSRPKGKGSRS